MSSSYLATGSTAGSTATDGFANPCEVHRPLLAARVRLAQRQHLPLPARRLTLRIGTRNGQTNPFGLAFDSRGELLLRRLALAPRHAAASPARYYEGISKTHDGLGFAPADHAPTTTARSAIAGIAH